MRRLAVVLPMTAAALAAPVPTGGSGVTVARVPAGAGISVRLPPGWHPVRRGLAQEVVRGGRKYQPAASGTYLPAGPTIDGGRCAV
jgi:hypothetical protein